MVPSGALAEPVLCTGRIRVTDNVTGRFIGYISKKAANEESIGFSISMTTQVDDALLVEFRPSSSLVTFDLVVCRTRLSDLPATPLMLKYQGQIKVSSTCS